MRRRSALSLALLACTLLALPAAASGQVQARVKNGEDTNLGDFPWTVALVYDGAWADDPDGGFFCGGTLLSETIVVTAAHCTAGMGPGDIDIFAGHHNRDREVHSLANYFDVASVHLMSTTAGVDPGDGEPVPRRDVSVLKLEDPVAGAETIPPVVPDSDDGLWSPGTDLEVSGWGRNVDDAYPLVLQHAVVKRWEDDDDPTPVAQDCEDGNFVAQLGVSLFKSADMLCALGADGEGAVVDSCNGDSGGPLTTENVNNADPQDRKLVGIVSFGSEDCDDVDEPGVYTRVGASDINAFVSEFLDVDPSNDDPQQIYASAGPPQITGSPREGETLTCSGSGVEAFSETPDDAKLRILRYDDVFGWRVWAERAYDLAADPAQQQLRYDVDADDIGTYFDCELFAYKTGVGGYALLLSPTVVGAIAPLPVVTTEVEPPPPPPPVPLPPALPEPPVVVPRDTGLPKTSRITRRCRTRRCTITIYTTDAGIPTSGVRSVSVTLTSTYACRRNGRRRSCTRRRTLRAATVRPGVFRVRTGLLPRAARNVLRVRATDAAGNREVRSRVYGFRLRRGR